MDRDLKKGPVRYLDNNENVFWQKLIEKYLYPLNHDKVSSARPCVREYNSKVQGQRISQSISPEQ